MGTQNIVGFSQNWLQKVEINFKGRLLITSDASKNFFLHQSETKSKILGKKKKNPKNRQ